MTFLPTPSAQPGQQLLLHTTNDQRPTGPSHPSMSESEVCRRVFQIQQPPTAEQDFLDVTDSKSASTSSLSRQLTSVSPCPAAAPVTAEFSLNKAQTQKKIVDGKYEVADPVAPPEKKNSPKNKLPNKRKKKKPSDGVQRSRRSKVLAVAQWKIPEEVLSKADFILSEVAKGRDIDFVSTAGATNTTARRERRGRKRKNPLSVEDETAVWVPKCISLVREVVFDARYVEYDNSPYGFLDQLVQRPKVFADPTYKYNDGFGEQYLQSIPDPPINSNKTSKVGVRFQARVCRHKEDYHDKRNGSYLPK